MRPIKEHRCNKKSPHLQDVQPGNLSISPPLIMQLEDLPTATHLVTTKRRPHIPAFLKGKGSDPFLVGHHTAELRIDTVGIVRRHRGGPRPGRHGRGGDGLQELLVGVHELPVGIHCVHLKQPVAQGAPIRWEREGQSTCVREIAPMPKKSKKKIQDSNHPPPASLQRENGIGRMGNRYGGWRRRGHTHREKLYENFGSTKKKPTSIRRRVWRLGGSITRR